MASTIRSGDSTAWRASSLWSGVAEELDEPRAAIAACMTMVPKKVGKVNCSAELKYLTPRTPASNSDLYRLFESSGVPRGIKELKTGTETSVELSTSFSVPSEDTVGSPQEIVRFPTRSYIPGRRI